jgi:hypothetical protein
MCHVQVVTLRIALPLPCDSFTHSDLQTPALQARINPATKDYILYVGLLCRPTTKQNPTLPSSKILGGHRTPRSFQTTPIQGLFKARLETTLRLSALKNQYEEAGRLSALKNQYEEATLTTVTDHHRKNSQRDSG